MDDRVSTQLLNWYDRNARSLPWRALPGEKAPDPYRVWLSEVMLQQTTVAAVKPYFQKFTQKWPTVQDLAAASDEDVMAAWAGLGYYSRARNLAKCAREVAEIGGFPENEAALLKLPGLGAYTAAAVAAIAFGKRAVVVDANVERVVARLFAITEPLPAARKVIREATDTITPTERSGDFAQAMMDLGATICTVRDPKCLLCPLSVDCRAKEAGDPTELPKKAPKKQRPERLGRAFWIEQNSKVWLVRRPGTGMLGGMRALPDDGWSARSDGHGEPPLAGDWESFGAIRHVFTHFGLTLELRAVTDLAKQPEGDGEWWPIEQLEEAGLPTAFAKAASLALARK
ncbi:A/G-specific adenine glycosylase [Altererythrobacter indicus]|uniref:Adenine DNA glycosylase n=1 Tax=Altericroceibacterium indicum TaxID=374177 RepID=A0A845A2V0_9SPHN|nr:A/G-specific adenine glycosylase [Altericroceibacterium indicum]MXP24532.1 A/G-specific adenine glycosylase [Altericroceibacterium indicum]